MCIDLPGQVWGPCLAGLRAMSHALSNMGHRPPLAMVRSILVESKALRGFLPVPTLQKTARPAASITLSVQNNGRNIGQPKPGIQRQLRKATKAVCNLESSHIVPDFQPLGISPDLTFYSITQRLLSLADQTGWSSRVLAGSQR